MHILLATSYMWNLNQYSLVQMEGKITKSPISTHHTGNRQSRQDCLYLSQWPCMVNEESMRIPYVCHCGNHSAENAICERT